MRGWLTLFVILVCVAFIWGGAGDTYVALTNTSPTEISCQEFYQDQPGAKWLELSGCMPDIFDAVEVKYKWGTVEGYYTPLKPLSGLSKPAALVVRTESLDDLKRIIGKKKISGVVQFGIESEEMVRDAITEADMKVTKDFMILEAGEKPELGVAVTMLSIGMLIGWYLVRKVKKGAAETEEVQPPDDQDESTPPPYAQPPSTPTAKSTFELEETLHS